MNLISCKCRISVHFVNNRQHKYIKRHRNAHFTDKTQDMDGAQLYQVILTLAWNLVIQDQS
jgi:hypothetical protein